MNGTFVGISVRKIYDDTSLGGWDEKRGKIWWLTDKTVILKYKKKSKRSKTVNIWDDIES